MVYLISIAIIIVIFFLSFLYGVVEPIYISIYKKPFYLYFYLFPHKIGKEKNEILETNFPFYNQLSNRKKIYFEHRVNEFINHYQFVGKENLMVSDEMKIIIAGTYTMLTFGMRDYLISLFETIVIYPSVYFSTANQEYHKGEFNPRMKAIVFSWEDLLLGHNTANDNLNLGLHEFSHALHFHSLSSTDPSSVLFRRGFDEVVKYFTNEILNSELHEKKYFRTYAYENQFEFIAVILEHFFETPTDFKKICPELYQQVSLMINFKEAYLN